MLSELQLIEDRTYKTYKSRLKASERLRALGQAWNFSMLALCTSTAVATIGLLTDDKMYGAAGPTLVAVLAVLSLIASLVVAAQSYPARSRDMFASYRRVQRISATAESLRLRDSAPSQSQIDELLKAYNDALDDSENHSGADYLRAFPTRGMQLPSVTANVALAAPYLSLIAPILVVVPFVIWATHAAHP
jgi:hypothetical protein